LKNFVFSENENSFTSYFLCFYFKNSPGLRIPMSVGRVKEDNDKKGEIVKWLMWFWIPQLCKTLKRMPIFSFSLLNYSRATLWKSIRLIYVEVLYFKKNVINMILWRIFNPEAEVQRKKHWVSKSKGEKNP